MKEKKYWQINTEKLAKETIEIARKANTEEDLKMGMEPLLQKAFKKMGVDIDIVRYEKTSTSFRGRPDAVYGYLTIEYKSPGKLSKKTDAKLAMEQLQRYLGEQAIEFGQKKEDFLEKAIGVATDGEHILFLRFTKVPSILQTPIPVEKVQDVLFPEIGARPGFQVLGPYPINKSSISNLLIFVRASARRPLTAENLAAVFAPTCQIAQQTVSELYSILMKAQRRQVPSRIKTFFQEWDRIFGVVYGQELEKAEKSAEETARLYNMPSGVRLKQLLFAIHTFYAFLMKLISIELVSLQDRSTVKSFVRGLTGMDDDELKNRLAYLESGADFHDQGIDNFLEADFFSWYLDGWYPRIADIFRGMVTALSDFEPATPILEPEWTKDLLQKLYELIVPRKLRHDLGEYYTPDWLAGYVVDKSGYKGTIGSRFLDPSCGSGTFLVHAINKAVKHSEGDEKTIAGHILKNIVGFDLNPIAVLSARTNYLIAFSRFIPYIRPISIPVYLCDSILTPSHYIEDGELPFENTIIFTTTKGNYSFPVSMQDKLVDVYKRIKELDDKGENGIWARYIKNAFAPVYLGKFDFVIGNPPWVRWGYLSDDYRERTLKLWKRYGLFSLKGYATRLGGGEKDFSMLFTYASADNYLKDKAMLGFIITMEVFKSKGAGEGFRRFELKDKKIPLKVLGMEDMVDLKPFQSANKTSLFFMRKGAKTVYPVPVIEWKRKPKIGRILPDWSLEEVKANSERKQLEAIPVNPDKLSSSWQTAKSEELTRYSKLKGQNPYKAYQGIDTQPYGVFHLYIKEVRPDGLVVIENIHNRGKREIKLFRSAIEPDRVFPAVSGREIVKFGIKPPFYVLISQDPQKREPYTKDWMIENTPLTYAYLIQFKDILLSRRSRVIKVISKVKTDLGMKPVISTKTTAFFALDNKEEAHYLCAILNSELIDSFIKSFSSAGRGFGAPSVMNNLAIPDFDASNNIHKKLAELSKKAHGLVKKDKSIEDIEKQINKVVKKLWNIK
jgi:type I restriction-modification system DNA methylase subunit